MTNFATALVTLLVTAGPGSVPIYPGVTLVESSFRLAGPGPDGAPALGSGCCEFLSQDPLGKVTSFYEKALGAKALGPSEVMDRYPMLKASMEAAARAGKGPPKDWRALVLEEIAVGNSKAPKRMVRIGRFPEGTRISIPAKELGPQADIKVIEIARAQGLMREYDESVSKMDNDEQAAWEQQYPPADARRYDIPVYPGARLERETRRAADCYTVDLVTRDAPDKVLAFYRQKLSGFAEARPKNATDEQHWFTSVSFNVLMGDGNDEDSGAIYVAGKPGARNRLVSVDPGFDPGPTQLEQRMGAASMMPPPRRQVGIKLVNEVLAKHCVWFGEDQSVVWRDKPSRSQDFWYHDNIGMIDEMERERRK